MSLWRSKPHASAIDPEGRGLLGISLDSEEPVFQPKGHSATYSANGGGKTTRVAVPKLLSFAASEPEKAVKVIDSKDGEIAAQAAPMLHEMGRKVAVIDDFGVRPELAHLRVSLNPFGAVVATHLNDPRDTLFATETVNHALIEEPKDDAKNRYFRAWPRNLIEFALAALLKRDPALATPGAVAALLADPDLLLSIAEIEAEEG